VSIYDFAPTVFVEHPCHSEAEAYPVERLSSEIVEKQESFIERAGTGRADVERERETTKARGGQGAKRHFGLRI
jgi:hypothetical protein